MKETKDITDAGDRGSTAEVVHRNSTTGSHNSQDPERPQGEIEAQQLLKRTPASYLLNQAYGLWVFVSLFLLTVILTRKFSANDYGVFAIAMAAFNTIAYIVAFGLEDAVTTFIPRVFSEHGKAAAASLIRRLLALRIAILTISLAILLFGIPILATLIGTIPGAASTAAGLRNPALLGHIIPIAVNVLGNGIAGLLVAVCAALMRMRVVFIVGSAIQLLILVVAWIGLRLDWGVDDILWLLAASAVLNALILMVWAAPILLTVGAHYRQPLRPVMKLGVSSWLTNLVQGALFKQVSLVLLGLFAISLIQISYFNLSSQLAHAASLLLVSGFGGVAGSALAAAFVGENRERLARFWQTLIKIETLLAAPILVFCVFNARNIAPALYGTKFDAVGPLLAVFLFFNILVRVLGTSIHQSTLYVVGKPGKVVLGQWLGLLTLVLLGIVFIPLWGPLGALIADGVAQVITGALLLAFVWRDLPRKYPLGFTLRVLFALLLAALPSIIWHPASRVLLVVSGCIFLGISIALLIVMRPLSAEDLDVVTKARPGVVPYLKWLARP